MKVNLNFRVLIVLSYLLSSALIRSFAQTGESAAPAKPLFAEKGLFDSDEILQITIKGNVRDLLRDRVAEPKYFPMELLYTTEDSSQDGVAGAGKNKGILPQDERKLLLSAFNDRFPERRTAPVFYFQGSKKDQAGSALQGRGICGERMAHL